MDKPWARSEEESPCIDLCVIHRESGYCMGCFRTGDEIARWSRMSTDARTALKATLPARAPAVRGTRRGGRKGRK